MNINGAVKSLTGWELADVVGHTDKHPSSFQVISSLYMDLRKAKTNKFIIFKISRAAQ
jgi:hypothetical protein